MSDEHAVKSLYFNILNNKSTKAAYRDSDEEKEKRHRCQLDKDRDKALKAQRKKLKERDIRDGKVFPLFGGYNSRAFRPAYMTFVPSTFLLTLFVNPRSLVLFG
eukprot:GEMP01072864.1.p1 GENE.GEMP01072864.1~~GEMP01072864.1.p1  ORF type:complete len:104 (-),score=16.74 GEMP01072864.1:743-1054(-)